MPTNYTAMVNRVNELQERIAKDSKELNSLIFQLSEAAIILERMESSKVNGPVEPALEVGASTGNIKYELMAKFIGSSSILVEYLSTFAINMGRGEIRPSDTFKQHDADISILNVARLCEWPSGFYRNATSSDNQLLVKTKRFIICIDNLPNYNVNVTMAYGDMPMPRDIMAIPADKLADAVVELEEALVKIRDTYFTISEK